MRDMVAVRMARQCRYVDYTLIIYIETPCRLQPTDLAPRPMRRASGSMAWRHWGSAGFSQTMAMPANGLFQDYADSALYLILYICNVKQTNDNNLL
jgi:hypothetical protein